MIKKNKNKNKKVRFKNDVNVILIPAINDFKCFNLNKEIWWCENDYILFNNSFLRDILLLMENNKGMKIQEAKMLLTQTTIRYDKTFFE
jgi:hypothetical protein